MTDDQNDTRMAIEHLAREYAREDWHNRHQVLAPRVWNGNHHHALLGFMRRTGVPTTEWGACFKFAHDAYTDERRKLYESQKAGSP